MSFNITHIYIYTYILFFIYVDFRKLCCDNHVPCAAIEATVPADLAMDPMQVTSVWISPFFWGHICVMRDMCWDMDVE